MRLRPLILTVALLAGALSWMSCESGEDAPPPQPDAGSLPNEGAGCLPGTPAGFPYTPGCCQYTVPTPEVIEAGFSSDEVGAEPSPDHIHVSFSGPTDTSLAVNWRTDPATKVTQLLYSLDEGALLAADGASDTVQLVTGHHMLYAGLFDADQPTRVHEVHICGLEPATGYFYKVGGPGAWSEVQPVVTGPELGSSEPFKIAVTGDSSKNPAVWAEIQEAIAGHGVAFQLFTGDATETGHYQLQWNEWFEASTGTFAFAQSLASIPFMPTNGNHENGAVNYYAQFALPPLVTEEEHVSGEEWYSFDYANLHLAVLNDSPEWSALGVAQQSWLDEDLAGVDRQRTPWVFAMHHRSLYSCDGAHGSDRDLRTAFQPLFDKHEVDIVLSGHDHLYERSHPIRGLDGEEGLLATETADAVPLDRSGTLYVVTAGAGADLYGADDSCDHAYISESTHNYVIVEIADRSLQLTAYRLDGSVIEQFEYSK